MQKQPFTDVLQNKCSKKLRNIHRNFIQKRIQQQRCFPVKIGKNFKNSFFCTTPNVPASLVRPPTSPLSSIGSIHTFLSIVSQKVQKSVSLIFLTPDAAYYKDPVQVPVSPYFMLNQVLQFYEYGFIFKRIIYLKFEIHQLKILQSSRLEASL